MASTLLRAGQNIASSAVSLESVSWARYWSTTYNSFYTRRSSVSKPKVVFVLGGPGCGKGTQCARIVREFGWVHLSAGDLLRAEVAQKSPEGELIESYIRDGRIVPVEITVNLLKKAILSSGKKRFLVDGFPRNEDNAQGWARVVGDAVDVAFVLYFECPEEEMEKRLLKRGETSGRSDDNPDTIRKRFRTFMQESLPVIKSFERAGKLRRVSAVPPPDEVFDHVRNLFQFVV
jgi:UMP-CMP kinase